eukprot:390353-Prymnesium_polylepis.1
MLARRWRWRTAQEREVGMVGGTCVLKDSGARGVSGHHGHHASVLSPRSPRCTAAKLPPREAAFFYWCRK